MNAGLRLDFYTQPLKQYVQTFQEYMLDYQRFSKNFDKLLHGLPQEQREFLIAIFSRKLFMHNGQHCSTMDFTPDEILEQYNLKEEMEKNIEKKDNYFKYKEYLLPEDGFHPWVFYYKLGINLLNNKEKINKTDIIDAGAFIGDSSLVLNELNPRKIYAFEPIPSYRKTLAETIRLNKLEKTVVPVPKLLDQQHGGQCVHTDNLGQKETLMIDTIDHFTRKNNLNVGLIKIHVEGKELNVLRGAEKTIRKFKPTIISAIYHNAEEFFELKPLIESWDLGYKFRFEKFCPGSFISGLNVICEVE